MCVDLELRMGSSEETAGGRAEQNETKSIQIPKKTGIEWREGKLISNMYVEHSVKIILNQGETRSVMIKRELHKDAVCYRLYSNCTANMLSSKPLNGLETSESRCEIRR
jgi:hypothetical protein